MNNFDKIINEAGMSLGNIASSLGNIAQVAKQTATSGNLAPFLGLFKSKKNQLKPVTFNDAEKASNKKSEGFADYSQGTESKWYGKKFIFSEKSVIFGGSGLEGLVGRVVSKDDDLVNKVFINNVIKQTGGNFDASGVVNTTSQKNRFWVVLSPKGELTVDAARKQSEVENQQQTNQQQTNQQQTNQQQNNGVGGIRQSIGGAISSLGTKLAGESNFLSIINQYSPDLLLEEDKKIKNIIPFNTVQYDTFFIYESSFSENVGKFLILQQNQKPSQKVGKFIKMEGNLAGLLQAGNQTNYPEWYFCKDFEKFEQEENEKQNKPTLKSIKGEIETSEPTQQPTQQPTSTTPA